MEELPLVQKPINNQIKIDIPTIAIQGSLSDAEGKRPSQHYTPIIVVDRFQDAADVLRQLPEVRAQGYFSVWPRIAPEFSDLVGRKPDRMRRPPPSARAISNMEETMFWTVGLDPKDAKIIWLRAERKHWKEICRTVGLSREAVHNRWLYGIYTTTWRLNGKPVSKKLSRRQVLAKIDVERSKQIQ